MPVTHPAHIRQVVYFLLALLMLVIILVVSILLIPENSQFYWINYVLPMFIIATCVCMILTTDEHIKRIKQQSTTQKSGDTINL